MSKQDPLTGEQVRAWELLGAMENHPSIRGWLSELDQQAGDRPPSEPIAPRARWRRWMSSFAATAVLAVAASVTAAYFYFAPVHYETRVGEQRDIVLSDGSRITLNTDTSLDVWYSKSRRYIELERGEALFSVAHNPQWPFDVLAGGTLTRAIGTAFNVDVRRSKVTVSVLEGTVRVAESGRIATDRLTADSGATDNPQPGFLTVAAALGKGEAIEIVPEERRAIAEKADVHRIDAWRARRLEFNDTPLATAVEEFNRYSRTRVVIGTPDLETVRVSGVFQIGDAGGFLFSLKEALGVQALESPGEVTVVRAGS